MAQDWAAVDGFITDRLIESDPALEAVLAANVAAGLPPIDVSPAQGRFLHLLARIAGARRILEIGTLGGYSTTCLARALPANGRLVTLEIDPHHAEVARANFVRAGVAERIDLRLGPAAATLETMAAEGIDPFDLAFIDADKRSNPDYLRLVQRLSRPGTVIVVDNVVRAGAVLDAASDDPNIVGTRALFDAIAAEPRLTATAVQTVGLKGWDGFVLAIFDGPA
jgi:predicted O-methyltransferase YrrM